MLVVFNLSGTAAEWILPQGLGTARVIDGHGLASGAIEGDRLRLPGHGVFYGRID